MPQIEVTFDINADGIMNISATKGTGKQSIQIKADSGLSDEEIKQMVRDAEANAAEDEVRSASSSNVTKLMVVSTLSKSSKEAEDKVTEEEKTSS